MPGGKIEEIVRFLFGFFKKKGGIEMLRFFEGFGIFRNLNVLNGE